MLLPSGFVGATASSYQIARSLRFNNADNARLTRTPGSAGNQKQWTWSGWIKRGNLTGVYSLFGVYGASNDTNRFDCAFMSNTGTNADTLTLYGHSTAWRTTTRVFRDPTAWFHLVVSWDTSLGNNAIKIWINGVEETSFSTSNAVTANTDYGMCGTGQHFIGCHWNAGSSATIQWFDGLMAEIHFIDGSVLTPTTFGETDAITGMWKAKQPVGLTYGTTGYWLSFADNASTTTLGEDDAGGLAGAGAGANDWTATNISVTAGVGNDSLTDTPTNYGTDAGAGGEVRGNYATWNPLDKNASATLANGNLDATPVSGGGVRASIPLPSTGKWYYCYYFASGSYPMFGVSRHDYDWAATSNTYHWYGNSDNGVMYANGTTPAGDGGPYTIGDYGLVCVDVDNNKIWLGRKRSTTTRWLGGGNPATNTSPTFSGGGGGGVYATNVNFAVGTWFFMLTGGGTWAAQTNFGQRAWDVAPPSGYKALCTQNLPDPAIAKPKQHFDTAIYTGTGASLAISTDGSTANNALALAPDLVWLKGRSGATDHAIYDNVRGVQKDWGSNLTTDETSQAQGVTAFDSTGFTVGTLAKLNTSAATYVSWLWKAGGAAASNTVGSITSSVSVNTTAGVSALTYTGTGANATIGHGIGVAPSMVIVKARTTAGADQGAVLWHASLTTPTTDYLVLSTTAALASAATMWNSTIPTSTVFSVGTNASTNTSGDTYVAYAFSPVDGFSAFGKYTGNAAADGPFVWCGFRPKFVLIKSSTAVDAWLIYDSARDTYNVMPTTLVPNTAAAEAAISGLDFLSNGFKLRTITTTPNAAQTYVFAAFAESPFKTARAR